MKYSYEVVKYDKNVLGRVLMQHKPGKLCDTDIHWHEELEFVYMIDGVLNANISGKNIQISNNEFYFCNSEEIHFTSTPDKERVIKYIVVLMSYDYLRPYFPQLEHMQFEIKDSHKPKIKELINKLIDIKESDLNFKELLLNSVLLEIYHYLLEYCVTKKENIYPKNIPENFVYAKKAIEYIGKNYKENITLKDIANLVGLTPTYFSKYFKTITEVSFIKYLNGIRLDYALMDIIYSNETVTNAAINNGFANVKSFIECCKNIYGCTPIEYKKKRSYEIANKK
ncbi:MAG: helix-turn-helix transcriptional regulator [Ruminococcus sp.]|nr:helix-turn-helix transcriptional regulator [Ruminococcus sp.]